MIARGFVLGLQQSASAPSDHARPEVYHPFRSLAAKEKYLAAYDRLALHWPVRWDALNVMTPFGNTFVRTSGPKGAPTLVLLPSLGTTSQVWEPNILALSREFRIFAPDLPGDFGRSVARQRVKSADHLVGWLRDLLDALGLRHAVRLLGFSYGGWIAACFAACCPERLQRVVLVAPAATVLPLRLQFCARALLLMSRRQSSVKSLSEWLFEDSITAVNPKHRRAVNELSNLISVGLQCFETIRPIMPTVLSDDVLRIWTVPTYYIVGEHEKMYSPYKACRRLNALAPAIKTETVLGAGHDVLALNSDLANRQILAFLS